MSSWSCQRERAIIPYALQHVKKTAIFYKRREKMRQVAKSVG